MRTNYQKSWMGVYKRDEEVSWAVVQWSIQSITTIMTQVCRHKALGYNKFIKFDRILKSKKKKKRYSGDRSQEFNGLKMVTEAVSFSIKPLTEQKGL